MPRDGHGPKAAHHRCRAAVDEHILPFLQHKTSTLWSGRHTPCNPSQCPPFLLRSHRIIIISSSSSSRGGVARLSLRCGALSPSPPPLPLLAPSEPAAPSALVLKSTEPVAHNFQNICMRLSASRPKCLNAYRAPKDAKLSTARQTALAPSSGSALALPCLVRSRGHAVQMEPTAVLG